MSQSETMPPVEVPVPPTGPTLTRRQLGRRLRALRDAAGKKMPDMAESKIMSTAKLYRIEAGTTSVSLPDVWALCKLYGADEKATDALSALAAGTRAN
jgi:transcriptional regulator with XRE-family HTH domain